MNKREKWLSRLVCMAVLTTIPLSASAAESTGEDVTPANKHIQAPIIVDSRDLTYNNMSGDIVASGDVTVQQGTVMIMADEIYGNSKSHMLASDGQMRILDPEQKMDIVGTTVQYNYQAKTGSMKHAKGKVQGDFVEGEDIEMTPDKKVFKNAVSTECPAKSPCWHIMAKDVEIHPDGTTLAHDATFYLKNKPVYHTKRHEKEAGDDHSFLPHPGYNSSDGFYIKQDLELPLFVDGLSAFLDWGYYSHHGFRSTEGLQYRWNGQVFRIVTGDFEDSDDEWIDKKIEYQWELYKRRIGKSKFHYRMDASHGLWEGAGKKSWHDEYNFYLSHDPIQLSKTLSLDLGAGYQVIKESYDDSTRDGMIYDARLTNEFSKKFKLWTGYHYVHDRDRLFHFEQPDLEREWRSGIRWSWNEKDALGLVIRYDLDKDELFERIYFFEKDLHCWKMRVKYEPDDGDSVSIKFSTNVW